MFRPDEEGFMRPQILSDLCTDCGACAEACPVLRPFEKVRPLASFAASSRDEDVLKRSASGGVATELSRWAIRRGGCVFGCRLEGGGLMARQVKIERESDLGALSGTKYVQSRVGNVLEECCAELQKGRIVVFIGTPCQIAGLRRYLDDDFATLVTVALFCEGAQSPEIFRRYLVELERRFEKRIVDIRFRDKRRGWSNPTLCLTFENGDEWVQPYRESAYAKAFKNCLRPSCYACSVRNGRCGADLMIGDFWGIEQIYRWRSTEKGVSAVLAYSERGLRILDELNILCREVAYRDVMTPGNPFLEKDPPLSSARRYLMNHYKTSGFHESVAYLALGMGWRRWLRVIRRRAGHLKCWGRESALKKGL